MSRAVYKEPLIYPRGKGPPSRWDGSHIARGGGSLRLGLVVTSSTYWGQFIKDHPYTGEKRVLLPGGMVVTWLEVKGALDQAMLSPGVYIGGLYIKELPYTGEERVPLYRGMVVTVPGVGGALDQAIFTSKQQQYNTEKLHQQCYEKKT